MRACDTEDLVQVVDHVVQDIIDLIKIGEDALLSVDDDDGDISVSSVGDHEDCVVFSAERFMFFTDTDYLRRFLASKVMDYLEVAGFVDDGELLREVTY